MFHERRTWVVHPAESAAWLAEKLIGHSWCSCAGWSLGGYLFLNDQTSPDGAFEVAIVKRPMEPDAQWWQVESITFGWFLSSPPGGWEHKSDYARDEADARVRACTAILELIAGRSDPEVEGNVAWRIEPPRLQTPEEHGSCYLCE